MPNEVTTKIKITQKEIEDIYDIEVPDVLEKEEKVKEPEPEFLTEEEQAFDTKLFEDLPNTDEEKQ